MKVEKLVVGQLQTNCYLVWDEKSVASNAIKEAIIIDPADDADYIIRKIQDFQLKPKLILATHGHFDHVLAIPELKLAFGIPFWMHEADLFLLKRSRETAKYFTGLEADPPLMPNKFLKEGDLIKFGKKKLKVIETPGHSPGGVSFYHVKRDGNRVKRGSRGVIFDGDTLFYRGIGRYDFSYASKEDLFGSIEKLLKLPEETIVYPGHGEETTIGEEKKVFSSSGSSFF